jgi:hypothetical protein
LAVHPPAPSGRTTTGLELRLDTLKIPGGNAATARRLVFALHRVRHQRHRDLERFAEIASSPATERRMRFAPSCYSDGRGNRIAILVGGILILRRVSTRLI